MLGSMEIRGERRETESGHEWGLAYRFTDFICKGNSTQDAKQVQLLLKNIVAQVHRKYKEEIKKITIVSDGASCFSSQDHIPFIQFLNTNSASNNEPEIFNWIFTESQTGKSPLDTHFSYDQKLLKKRLSSGKDLGTCDDVYEALAVGLAGTTVCLVDFEMLKLDNNLPKPKIKDVSLIHDIRWIRVPGKAKSEIELRLFSGFDTGMKTYLEWNNVPIESCCAPAKVSDSTIPHMWFRNLQPQKKSAPKRHSTIGAAVESSFYAIPANKVINIPQNIDDVVDCSAEMKKGWAAVKINKCTAEIPVHIKDRITKMYEEAVQRKQRLSAEEACLLLCPLIENSWDLRLLLNVDKVNYLLSSAHKKTKEPASSKTSSVVTEELEVNPYDDTLDSSLADMLELAEEELVSGIGCDDVNE